MPSKKREDSRPELTDQIVLSYLIEGKRPASIRQIAGDLALQHVGRRMLPKILHALKRRGEVEELRGGKFAAVTTRGSVGASRPAAPSRHAQRRGQKTSEPQPSRPGGRDPNVFSGRMVTHHDGYGFVVPAEPQPNLQGDLFIPPHALADAMHGDHVEARIERRRPDGRAEGRVLRVIEREHPTVVGLFRYATPSNTVLPYDPRLLHEVIIPPGQELTPALRAKLGVATGAAARAGRLPELDGAVVNAEITRFPRGGVPPAGRVLEILGRPGEIGVDVEIMIRKHHLPFLFPEEVLAEAQAFPREVREQDAAGRRDFRDLPIVTIDGETARDFDDAVYVESLPGGAFNLQVHIADVSHYVHPGSPLDGEARLRGNSVYFPNRAVPMLPEDLSNGLCSLNPQVDRLVMSVLMRFDEAGKMTSAEFGPGIIRSAERMTYTNVNLVLDGDAAATERYAAQAAHFGRMRALALILNKRRMARGSIDFDLPEPILEFDEFGRMTAIVRSQRNIANRIIEEFMLAANEAVAKYLDRRGLGSLHRIHEKPDPKKVLEFEELARTFGYTLGVEDLLERRVPVRHGHAKPTGRERRSRNRPMSVTTPLPDFAIRPQHYQRLTEKIAGKPEERILSFLMLRSLRQARYAAEALGHFALAAQEYTHFTSPIRRYPDLIVHRVLRWAIENPAAPPEAASRHAHAEGEPSAPGPYRMAELKEIAIETSEAERRAEAAERELVEWKTAQFMESHIGEEYDALIISVQKFGFFAELVDLFVEGLVPINLLEQDTGEHCIYRETDHAILLARSRRMFRIGDRLRLRVERIDPFRHRVEFALAEPAGKKS